MSDAITHCRWCGARIFFIRTKKGKLMPMEPVPVFLIENSGYGGVYYTGSGERIQGVQTDNCQLATHTVFAPHFGFCPHYVAPHPRRDKVAEAIRERIAKERLEAAERERKKALKAEELRAEREWERAQVKFEEL